jgi:hypothetical protein
MAWRPTSSNSRLSVRPITCSMLGDTTASERAWLAKSSRSPPDSCAKQALPRAREYLASEWQAELRERVVEPVGLGRIKVTPNPGVRDRLSSCAQRQDQRLPRHHRRDDHAQRMTSLRLRVILGVDLPLRPSQGRTQHDCSKYATEWATA